MASGIIVNDESFDTSQLDLKDELLLGLKKNVNDIQYNRANIPSDIFISTQCEKMDIGTISTFTIGGQTMTMMDLPIFSNFYSVIGSLSYDTLFLVPETLSQLAIQTSSVQNYSTFIGFNYSRGTQYSIPATATIGVYCSIVAAERFIGYSEDKQEFYQPIPIMQYKIGSYNFIRTSETYTNPYGSFNGTVTYTPQDVFIDLSDLQDERATADQTSAGPPKETYYYADTLSGTNTQRITRSSFQNIFSGKYKTLLISNQLDMTSQTNDFGLALSTMIKGYTDYNGYWEEPSLGIINTTNILLRGVKKDSPIIQ